MHYVHNVANATFAETIGATASRAFDAIAPSAPGSLGASHGSIRVPRGGSFFRRFLAFAGPGYLVATGYMDPGNWATALAGGSQFGTALLYVAVLSSLMAIVLRALSARLSGSAVRGSTSADSSRLTTAIAWLIAVVILGLNGKLIYDALAG